MPRPKVRPENRQRSDRACLACKASKIRCNSQHPCGSCLRRDQAESCIYSGIDRRRRGRGDAPRATQFPEVAPLRANVTSGQPSPNGSSVAPGTPFGVAPAIPDFSNLSDPEIDVVDKEHSFNPNSGEKVHVGETSSLSFLYFLRRTVKSFVGSVPFTDEERHLITVESESRIPGIDNPQPSQERLYSLLDSYFEATSGVLDLFTADEIDILISDRRLSHGSTIQSHFAGDNSAALDVALAIGAQTRGLNDDLPLSEAYFSRACTIAFKDALMSQTLGKIRLFILLAFYTLSSCKRNSAAMFLAIAAKAAVILDLGSSQEDRTLREELSTREKVWSSLRNLDILSSFIIGRPKNLPLMEPNAGKLQAINETEIQSTRSNFTAMVGACILLEGIVGTLGKNNNILHVPTAEDLLQQLRQWSRQLPESVRRLTSPSSENHNLEPTERQSLTGSMHVSCVYYFAVMLITRPFLVAYLTSRLRGKAPDHLISDPDQASDIKLKNNKVSRLAQVCVGSAINMVDICTKAKGINFNFGNLCLIEAWLFGAGLVLGFSMFAGEPRRDIEDSFQNTCIILADIALTSQQALLYHNILISFAEAVTKYRQRVADEMHYAVQQYMDRILVIETPTMNNTAQHDHTNTNRDIRKSWENCLAVNIDQHPETDPRTLLQMPSCHDQQADWGGADLQFLDYFSPELEPFDQLFYTVE